MTHSESAPLRSGRSTRGLTVFGCEQDEADVFRELCPRFGFVPTITPDAVSAASVKSIARNRCASVGHKSDISGPTLHALKESGVEYISTRSIGFDHIDLRTADELGITVENVVYAPDGVADYTLMLMLMVIRHATTIVGAALRHDFRLNVSRGKDLGDMTVGVVGAGNIGSAVVRRLHGFGCRVLACSERPTPAVAAEFVPLDELLRESDIVTLHLPLDGTTRRLIGQSQLAIMKPGAFLINTARGALVDTGALTAALERGHLGGAALDVLEDEDGIFYVDCTERGVDHRFLSRLQRLPNVVVTPHTAYYTERALHDTVERTLMNCVRFERRRTDDEAQGRNLVRGVL